VRIARIISIGVGIAGTALSTQLGRLGPLIEIANKVIQIFTGPLLGIYLLGMFSYRARSKGVLIGGALGAVVAVYVAFDSPIAFIWPTVFGLAATLAVGYLASLLIPQKDHAGAELTWSSVMRRNSSAAAPASSVDKAAKKWISSSPVQSEA
ncbi:MAG TPA: hypothetical protein VG722_03210, partial [Tepidisphaeraceae bacterium]|nr:hypothetical protein [Tepidisphaeraceae bacterium]